MQQRVALARALAIQPRVLLLDEPLSALDAKVRVQLREEIRRIQTGLGITTIYVTHDQEEALSISDRVAVLSKGQIEQIGTPAEIYGAPGDAVRGGVRRHDEPDRDDDLARHAWDDRHERRSATDRRGAGEAARASVSCCSCDPRRCELAAANGENGGLAGKVVSHTFLGSVTRVRVKAGESEWTSDMSGERAAALPVGSRVGISFPSEGAQLLSLAEPLEADAGRSVKIPSTPATTSSRIRASSFTV